MTMQILVVCTANICRSPMAERFLRRAAAGRAVDATITSAGLLRDGEAASTGSVQALTAHGLELGDHRSRRIEAPMIASADLVVTMEVRHVREAAVLAPDRFGAIYTLRELVQRAQHVGPRRDQPVAEWLAQLGEGRRAADLMRATDLDITDPYCGPPEGYVATAAMLADLTERLADALWGPA
jgi:protein-tyrosine phosphatase